MNMPLEPIDNLRRERAALADMLSTEFTDLAALWAALNKGELQIVDNFFTTERCFLVLESSPARTPLQPRQRLILERILCGDCQNAIAIELDLAPSTVALHAREAMKLVGVTGKPSRCHPLLMAAALAARTEDEPRVGRSSSMAEGQRSFCVISIRRPDRELSALLPPAEQNIVSCLLEGLCYLDICERRGTAMRTVANQIATIFRRFHVSGRNELVCLLLQGGRPHGPPITPSSTPAPAPIPAMSFSAPSPPVSCH